MKTHWTGVIARLPQKGLLGLVQGYRLFFKAWLGNRCRFEPSCSAYALQALRQHGALQGAALSAGRLLRCHPWCAGGCDPVPDTFSATGAGLFTRWMPSPLNDQQRGVNSPLPRKNP